MISVHVCGLNSSAYYGSAEITAGRWSQSWYRKTNGAGNQYLIRISGLLIALQSYLLVLYKNQSLHYYITFLKIFDL